MKRTRIFILTAVLMLGATVPVLAANGTTEQEAAAAYLREAGIMLGNESGDMMLDQGLTRTQMAALLTRVVANPEHVETDSAFYRSQCKFSDVPEWAKVYVGYCVANGLVAGYGNGLYGSNDPVTPAAACTVILRYLNVVKTDWSYDTACQVVAELELAPAESLAEAKMSRGNMAILIHRVLVRVNNDPELSKPVLSDHFFYTGDAPDKDAESIEQPASEKMDTINVDAARQDIIDRTNALRKGQGLSTLKVNDMLMQAAQVRADEMKENCFYSHTRPDGRKYNTVTDCPYTAENIHQISDWQLKGVSLSAYVVDCWEASAGHRKNMLNNSISEIGIGLAHGVNLSGDSCWYCVQLFLHDGCVIGLVDEPALR